MSEKPSFCDTLNVELIIEADQDGPVRQSARVTVEKTEFYGVSLSVYGSPQDPKTGEYPRHEVFLHITDLGDLIVELANGGDDDTAAAEFTLRDGRWIQRRPPIGDDP